MTPVNTCPDHWHCHPHLAAHTCDAPDRSRPCPTCGAVNDAEAAPQCPGCGANQTDERGACCWCGTVYRIQISACAPINERAAVVAFIRELIIKERGGNGLVYNSVNLPAELRSYAARVLSLLADNIEIGAHASGEAL